MSTLLQVSCLSITCNALNVFQDVLRAVPLNIFKEFVKTAMKISYKIII